MKKEDHIKTSKTILQSIFPGKVLANDFMKPRGLTLDQVANETGVPGQYINDIIEGKRPITFEVILRLVDRYFVSSAQVWQLFLEALDEIERLEACDKIVSALLKQSQKSVRKS